MTSVMTAVIKGLSRFSPREFNNVIRWSFRKAYSSIVYDSECLGGYFPTSKRSALTFSTCGKLTSEPRRIIDAFPTIVTPNANFKVRWGGIREDPIANLASLELKTAMNNFVDERGALLHGDLIYSYKKFYEDMVDLLEIQDDDHSERKFDDMYENFLKVYHFIEEVANFQNDIVKDLMHQLMVASLGGKVYRPKWKSVVSVHSSTSTFPDQRLALNVDIVHSSKKGFRLLGVTDTALVSGNGAQLLIAEGKGDRENGGETQLVLSMLAQCALSECTHPIWGFTLNSKKYSIFKLEVVESTVLVEQFPPCNHGHMFQNFIPLMGLCEYVAELQLSRITKE